MEVSALTECLQSQVRGYKKCLELATESLKDKLYLNAQMTYSGLLNDIPKGPVFLALNLDEMKMFSLQSCYAYALVISKSDLAWNQLEVVSKTSINVPFIPYLKAVLHTQNNRISAAKEQIQACEKMLQKGYNFKSNEYLNEDIVPELNEDFLRMKLEGLKTLIGTFIDPELRKSLLKVGEYSSVDSKVGRSISVQTKPIKTNNASVQTETKDKELLAQLADIRNKINNLQSEQDSQLKKQNNELHAKLLALETKQSELDFFKEKILDLEVKLKEAQQQNEVLQKLLMEQIQHSYHIQQNIYQSFLERCEYKLEFLKDIQIFVTPSDRPTPEECKQDIKMWNNILKRVEEGRKNFETYYSGIDGALITKEFLSIKVSDWPGIPTMPIEAQEMVYKNFKLNVQQNKSFYSLSMPQQFSDYYVNSYRPSEEACSSQQQFSKAPGRRQSEKVFKSDEDVQVFVQNHFKNHPDWDIWGAVAEIQDKAGGTLVGLPKTVFLNEMKKFKQKNDLGDI